MTSSVELADLNGVANLNIVASTSDANGAFSSAQNCQRRRFRNLRRRFAAGLLDPCGTAIDRRAISADGVVPAGNCWTAWGMKPKQPIGLHY
jgi:hypothetical protein